MLFTMDSSPKKEKQIAIIGAGISGLLACKHAMEKGFNPIVFEERNDVGGVWYSGTISSTKLQTPKDYFQFSDFAWPNYVSETFPQHTQVMNYIRSYAIYFNILPHIKFNCKVMGIDYVGENNSSCWNKWGGNGDAFSPKGKWSVVVQEKSSEPYKVYHVDFVILCVGKFSGSPNIPITKGASAFNGEVIHSMDYASMNKFQAAKYVKDKRVTVVGFQKSALDIAVEIAKTNGIRNPCTLLFRKVYWSGSENLVRFSFRNLNRFSELMIHKPGEGLILWFLALLLSRLRWIFSKFVELYLKWTYPLKKYNMVPDHSFLKQIYSCMFMVLPEQFYDKVKEGSLILKRSRTFSFCKNGLNIDDETAPLETDIVIFATGFKSDEKISNIFSSTYFKKCITGSAAPFYRECIHPRIPQLAILGYSESPATLFTFELRAKWIAHFLAGKFSLPTINEIENDVRTWEKNARRYAKHKYKRACVGVLLQIYCNDHLCKDMGCNPKRKKWFLPELFSSYKPADYANL